MRYYLPVGTKYNRILLRDHEENKNAWVEGYSTSEAWLTKDDRLPIQEALHEILYADPDWHNPFWKYFFIEGWIVEVRNELVEEIKDEI